MSAAEGYRLPNDPDGTQAYCKDCRCYYEALTTATNTYGQPVTWLILRYECRRHAPANTIPSDGALWPWTEPMLWCGEFRP